MPIPTKPERIETGKTYFPRDEFRIFQKQNIFNMEAAAKEDKTEEVDESSFEHPVFGSSNRESYYANSIREKKEIPKGLTPNNYKYVKNVQSDEDVARRIIQSNVKDAANGTTV
jgi:hypothetical protein